MDAAAVPDSPSLEMDSSVTIVNRKELANRSVKDAARRNRNRNRNLQEGTVMVVAVRSNLIRSLLRL